MKSGRGFAASKLFSGIIPQEDAVVPCFLELVIGRLLGGLGDFRIVYSTLAIIDRREGEGGRRGKYACAVPKTFVMIGLFTSSEKA